MTERRYAALGQRLRALREARALPPSTVARRLGRSVSTVYALELGRRRPSPAVLARLVAVLGADYDELARLAGYTREA